MLTKCIIVLAVITLVLSSNAFAQGEFLRKGESCLGGGPITTFATSPTGTGLTAGISIIGSFDLAFSYIGADESGDEYSAMIAIHSKRQMGKHLTGFAVNVGYDVVKLEESSWSYSTRTYHFLIAGVTGYDNMYPHPDIQVSIGGTFAFLYNSDNGVTDHFKSVESNVSLSLTTIFGCRGNLRPYLMIGGTQGSLSGSDINGVAGLGLLAVL
ncbi:MAG: hypothetical protein AB1483_11595 [Candidatus Zixiibacteriota bacterium]